MKDEWTFDDKSFGSIKVKLPKGERLIGFVQIDRNYWLLKSSNNWYWNIYTKNGKPKLQKLK